MQHSIDTDRFRAPESAYLKNRLGSYSPLPTIPPQKFTAESHDWGSAVMDSIGGRIFIGCLRSLRIYIANHWHGQIFPSRISRKVGCSKALLGAG